MPTESDNRVEPASVVWSHGAPRSLQFDDVYYSGDGLDEARHVFLGGNQLPRRWQGRRRFVIGETGFGCGLNFLLTVDLWQRRAEPGAVLHYLAIERFPMDRRQLQRALAGRSLPEDATETLLAGWPAPEPGWVRLRFSGGRVRLTLMLGECLDMLRGLSTPVDCWYLDGFAPSRNPAMWSPEVLQRIGELTSRQGSFATFTAAGSVRKGLVAAGFEVLRLPGHGRKRHMLAGVKRTDPESVTCQPWYRPPPVLTEASRRVAVIGAGLAGCAVAAALVDRGWRVSLYDSAAVAVVGASASPAGVLMPALDAGPSTRQRWFAAGFRHTLAHLRGSPNPIEWRPCGVLATATGARERQRYARLVSAGLWDSTSLVELSAAEASLRTGLESEFGGLFLPQAGWVNAASLCRAWLAETGQALEPRFDITVRALRRDAPNWSLYDENDSLLGAAPVVVFCAGAGIRALAPCRGLPLSSVRGQLSELPATKESLAQQCVVSGPGYLLPALDGRHLLGATYDVEDPHLGIREDDHRRNTETLRSFLPAFPMARPDGGWVGFRSVSPDYLPLVGPLPDPVAWERDYGDLHLGRQPSAYPASSCLPGLFTVTGLGSRGLASALLAAELTASLIEGEPLPVETDLAAAVHPGRFLIRRFRRGRV